MALGNMVNVRAAYDQEKKDLAAYWQPHPVPDGERIRLEAKRDRAKAQVDKYGQRRVS